jgi:hypothetical protein
MKDNNSMKKVNKPTKTNKKENEDIKLDKTLEMKDSLLKELKEELVIKDEEITLLKEKLSITQERLLDIIQEKKLLEQRKTELELKEIEMDLKNFEKLKNEHHQLSHRSQVTKKQLDQARADLKIHEQVITDLEKRGFLDYLLRRFPESFKEYQKNH